MTYVIIYTEIDLILEFLLIKAKYSLRSYLSKGYLSVGFRHSLYQAVFDAFVT
jgi:hypothetical protein